MSVEIYLPCVPFQVVMRPQDPGLPTDLEMAALFFLWHHEPGGIPAEELIEFLGIGTSVTEDLLIRFLNRGWISIDLRPPPPRLRITEAAQNALDRPSEAKGRSISSTEEGRSFTLCFDLIGGEFAAIPPGQLVRAMEDRTAVPRGLDERAPYGQRMNGFVSSGDESDLALRQARLARALMQDNRARDYLRQAAHRATPHLQIMEPGRPPTLDDVRFYRCDFDVFAVRQAHAEEDVPADTAPLMLRCVGARARQALPLGQFNAEAVYQLAVDAAVRETSQDRRLLKCLQGNAARSATSRRPPGNPLDRLREMTRDGLDRGRHNDMLDLVDSVRDWVEALSSGRLDLSSCGLLEDRSTIDTILATAEGAHDYVIVSAPRLRSNSSALTDATGGALSRLARANLEDRLLVQAVHGTTTSGITISDESAVKALLTGLNPRVDVRSPQEAHLKTPLVLADGQSLILLASSLFDEHVSRGLQLRIVGASGRGQLERIADRLPPRLRDKIAASGRRHAPESAELPAEVVATLRDLRDTVADDLGHRDITPERRQEAQADVERQLHFLSDWIETRSETVEALIGTETHDRFWRLMEHAPAHRTLVVGIAGTADRRALVDLEEDIGSRLSRQDADPEISGASTVLVLPAIKDFDEPARRFERLFRSAPERACVLRQSYDKERHPRVSFAMTPNNVLLAHDGLLSYLTSAGRATKGTYVGLALRGTHARAEAARFLAAEWPSAASYLMNSVVESAAWPVPRHVSRNRRDALLRQGRAAAWTNDGNRGATAAWLAFAAGEFGSVGWPALLDDAKAMSNGLPEERRVGYALTKAAAIAEERGDVKPFGAREALARLALAENNLATLAYLADDLPAAWDLRKPLPQMLAVCLATRQAPPTVAATDYQMLTEPSETLMLLACLLMLDGLGGDLPSWLTETPGEDALAGFTRQLAATVARSGERLRDLSHATNTLDSEAAALGAVWGRLRELASRETERPLRPLGIDGPVGTLHIDVFRTEGAFLHDLFAVVLATTDDGPPDFRAAPLRDLLRGKTGDLGVDLLKAGQSDGVTLNPVKLADAYLDRKNDEMAARTGLDLVDFDRRMQFFRTTSRNVLKLLVTGLVPLVLGGASQAEQALTEAARRLLDTATDRWSDSAGGAEAGAWLRERLRLRIQRIDANLDLARPPWALPAEMPVALLRRERDHKTCLAALRDAFFRVEFPRQVSFSHVVRWFLEQDAMPQDGPEAQRVPPLETLHRLMDTSLGTVGDSDLQDAELALRHHLSLVLTKQRTKALGAAALAEEIARRAPLIDLGRSPGEPSLETIAAQLAEAAELLQDVVSDAEQMLESDTVMAIIAANDLRQTGAEAEQLDALWTTAGQVLNEALAGKLEDFGPKLLPQQPSALDLRRATHLTRLAPVFNRPITLKPELVFRVSERALPLEAHDSAREMVNLVKQAVQGDRAREVGILEGAAPEDIERAVAEFLSDLPRERLLPITEARKGHWAVTFGHPSMIALGFARAKAIEILIPYDPFSVPSLSAAPGPEPGIVRIALGLFYVPDASSLPWLKWRDLIALADQPARIRRLRVANLLAKQRFATATARVAWWEALGKGAELMMTELIDMVEPLEDPDGGSPWRSTARNLVEACFALNLLTTDDSSGLQVHREGKTRLAEMWANEDPDLAAPRGLLVQLLDRLIRAEGTTG